MGNDEEIRGGAGRAPDPQTARAADRVGSASAEELRKVVHDLQVHQLELAQQNEALRDVQEALEQSRAEFEELFEFAPVGYVSIDDSDAIVQANLTAASMLRVDRGSLSGRAILTLFEREDRDAVYLYLRRLRQRGTEPPPCEVRLASGGAPDRPTYVQLHGQPGPGNPLRRLALADVTERRRQEDEKVTAQERAHKLESLGVLAGGIAHDFNNLLAALQSNVEQAFTTAAEANAPPDPATLETLRRVFARATGLTKQLLTFAGGGAPIVKTCTLSTIAGDAARLAVSGSRLACHSDFPPGLPFVRIDPGQFGQVVHNIALNAVQAMPEGGSLHVSAQAVGADTAARRGLAAGEYVKLVLRDDGPGMPESVRARIFEPYFTTKQGGSGLGLAIAYSIVRRHGGAMEVKSDPGAGTTFEIFVPVSNDAQALEPASPAAVCAKLNARVLVMDDEAELRMIFARALKRLGCEAELVSEGKAAIAAYRAALERGQPFDAVVLDLTVAAGLGGKATMSTLAELDPNVRGVVTSGYSSDPVMADPRAHGFVARLAKPFDMAEFEQAMVTAVEKKA